MYTHKIGFDCKDNFVFIFGISGIMKYSDLYQFHGLITQYSIFMPIFGHPPVKVYNHAPIN